MARIGIIATVTEPYIVDNQIVPVSQTITAAGSGTLTTDNLYLEFDPTVVPDTPTMSQVLTAILNFLQTNGSISV